MLKYFEEEENILEFYNTVYLANNDVTGDIDYLVNNKLVIKPLVKLSGDNIIGTFKIDNQLFLYYLVKDKQVTLEKDIRVSALSIEYLIIETDYYLLDKLLKNKKDIPSYLKEHYRTYSLRMIKSLYTINKKMKYSFRSNNPEHYSKLVAKNGIYLKDFPNEISLQN